MAKKIRSDKPSAQKKKTTSEDAKVDEAAADATLVEATVSNENTDVEAAAPADEVTEVEAEVTGASAEVEPPVMAEEPAIDGAESTDTATDVQLQPEPEPEPEQAAPPPTVQPEQRSIVLPLVIGGVIAAAAGFIAARALDSNTDTARALDAALARIETLETTVENLPEPVMLDIPDPVDLTPVETALNEQADSIAALSDRVDALATQPAPDGTLPAAAFDAALSELRATAREQQDEIDALIAEAQAARAANETAAKATVARAAVAQIITALDSGAGFDSALATVAETGLVDVSEDLSAAASGVAPLSELQAGIATAARDALFVARGAADTGGVGSFFQRQLGARSVTPREGDDPDAVLSRIEAAVKAGDLSTALTEAEALPPEAQDAMGDWLSQATTRNDAVTAAQALADTLAAL